MSATHTGGEWSIGSSEGMITVVSEDDLICAMYHDGEQGFANAKLMAAAPTMLLALEVAEKALLPVSQANKALAIVQAAIAKAKGL